MFTPVYRLKKETPEFKKGTVFIVSGCYSNGDYHYQPKETDNIKFHDESLNYSYEKFIVEKQPNFFEKVSPLYLTIEQVKKVKRFLRL